MEKISKHGSLSQSQGEHLINDVHSFPFGTLRSWNNEDLKMGSDSRNIAHGHMHDDDTNEQNTSTKVAFWFRRVFAALI